MPLATPRRTIPTSNASVLLPRPSSLRSSRKRSRAVAETDDRKVSQLGTEAGRVDGAKRARRAHCLHPADGPSPTTANFQYARTTQQRNQTTHPRRNPLSQRSIAPEIGERCARRSRRRMANRKNLPQHRDRLNVETKIFLQNQCCFIR